MGVGYDLYGKQSGYTQAQWDALPQSKKDDIKRFIIGLQGGSPLAVGAIMGAQPGGGTGIASPIAGGAVLGGGYGGGYSDPGGYYDDGGGGGYGGGGSAPLRNLASSPEWLAFLNALGLEEGQFRADIERQRAFAKSAAEHQIAQLGPQYDQQRRGITASNESRGMSRSGGFQRDLAVSRANQGRDTSNINMGLGATLSGLETSLANKMMDLGARRAQQELSLRASGYV